MVEQIKTGVIVALISGIVSFVAGLHYAPQLRPQQANAQAVTSQPVTATQPTASK